MELITGVALHYKLAGGALPEKEVLRLGAQLADGLEAAHAQGIIHRDLKPGNLHITKDDRLKILDFGLAQWIPAADQDNLAITVSKAHEIIGTLPYMAPEQLRGQRADRRTDIYAAGAVLYEMATGKRPHLQTSGPQLISAILERPLTAPSLHNPQITPALDSIIVKALDKDPNRRYQSARELQIDLERLSSGLTPVVQRHNRRKGLFAATAAAVVIFLLSCSARARCGWHSHPAVPSGEALSIGRHADGDIAPTIKARRSVAVLGFKNLSGKPDEAWISTALAEMLSTELAAGEQVRTIPGENIARMKVDLSWPMPTASARTRWRKFAIIWAPTWSWWDHTWRWARRQEGKIRLDFACRTQSRAKLSPPYPRPAPRANSWTWFHGAGPRFAGTRHRTGVRVREFRSTRFPSRQWRSGPALLRGMAELQC